jgi:hypothetical protein
MSGGFGAGKTTALALKILSLASVNTGIPGLVIAPNWRTMWGTTFRCLRNVFRAMTGQKLEIVDRQAECYIDFGANTHAFLRSAKNVDGFDGLDVGWIAGDECRHWSRHAWEVAQGRARVRCPVNQVALTSTPAMGWMSDEFDSGKPNRKLIVAPTTENAKHLRDGFVEDLKLSYSSRLWRALIQGMFTILEGAVFEHFDPSANSKWLVDLDPKPNMFQNRKVYLAVDPGYRRSSWLWIAQVGETDWVVFDELMLDNHNDTQAVQKVNARGWPIDEVWCDPASGNIQSYEGGSTLRALRKIKTRSPRPIRTIVGSNREIAFGIDKLRVLLGGEAENQPMRLKFAKRLHRMERGQKRGIIRDLGSLRYPEDKEGRAIEDKPLKDGVTDHSTDALRYWGVGMWLSNRRLRSMDPHLADKAKGYREMKGRD